MMESASQVDEEQPVDVAVPEVLRALAARRYPITDQRRALVSLVVSNPRRFTADDLLRDLRHDGIKVGRATVFRTLELLVRLGYVGKVLDGERWAYTRCSPGHHHHLTCSDCGQVVELTDCPASALLGELELRTGYRIDHHRLEVTGICPTCRWKSQSRRPDTPI